MQHRGPEAAAPSTEGNQSGLLRAALLGCALFLALLPIPVTLLRLLPAYEMHARFLAFYTPLVCLLALAYLVYVRDSLARLMFASILNPLPEPDPYYRMSAAEAVQRRFRQVQGIVLALLPALLLATSFYCLVRYTDRLRESMAIAATQPIEVPETGEEVGRATPDSTGDSAAEAAPAAARERERATKTSRAGAVDTTPAAVAPAAPEPGAAPPRETVLQGTKIDAIPMFTELTVLYIGIFVSALLALILMALKEHAKEAMGLSEQELVVGRYASTADVVTAPLLAPPPGD